MKVYEAIGIILALAALTAVGAWGQHRKEQRLIQQEQVEVGLSEAGCQLVTFKDKPSALRIWACPIPAGAA